MFNNNTQLSLTSLLGDVLVELPERRDLRGALTFVENIGWPVQRVFWIYDVPEEAERGGHAHRTCAELFVAVRGSVEVTLTDGVDTQTFILDTPTRGLHIRPTVWCRLAKFSSDFIGVCLASQDYLPDGYIHSYEEYLRYREQELHDRRVNQ